MINNLEQALAYRKHGLSVIPVWSPEMVRSNPPQYYIDKIHKRLAENKESENPVMEQEIIQKCFIEQCKISLVPWTEYQTRLPTKEKVTQWFTQNPTANIGIVTGKISNLVVFDLDSQDAVDFAEKQGGFPDTVKVKTGKGDHVYMRHPGFRVKGDVNHNYNLDIRGDGNVIVSPPSAHGSGKKYEWVDGHSIFEIDPAPCEPWMIEYLEEVAKGNRSGKKNASKSSSKPSEKPTNNTEYSDLLKNGCVYGCRNASATSLVGHLLKSGIEAGEVWEKFKQWNGKNKPPIDESELRSIFKSIEKSEIQSKKKKEAEKQIDITMYLDDSKKIVSEYDEKYLKIPFAGDNLTLFERKLNGGLLGGRLYIVGGIPSSSKTLIVNNIADNICLNGHPVIFFSYVDGRSEIRFRSLSRFSDISIEEFNNKRLENKDLKKMCASEKIKKILKLKYVIPDIIPVEKWDSMIQQVIAKHKKEPVIIVDYLRKLKTEGTISDERLRVDNILTYLTDLAKKHNVPIVVISELARDSYKSGQRLSMASFKESGSIEYVSSWLGILAAVEEKGDGYELKKDWERIIQHDGNVDLIVFKAKRGTGTTGKISLKVDKDHMVVEDRVDELFFGLHKKQSIKSKYA